MNNAVQTTPKASGTVRGYLESDAFKSAVAKALPKHLTPDRFIRVACTTLMRVPKLAQCEQHSFFNALLTLSQLGLEPDGRRAHLIPFENRKRGTVECQLIVDYKGLVELAMRSGTIARLHADLICDNDEFAYDMGSILHHRIDFRKDRGEPYAAYAMAVTKTGEVFVQVMTKAEIEGIRDKSQGWIAFKKGWAKQSPWQDYPGEQWKKTAFRRLSKWLPLSAEYRDAVEKEDGDSTVQVTTDEPGAERANRQLVADSAPFTLPEPPNDDDDQPPMDIPKAETVPEPTADPATVLKPGTAAYALKESVEAMGYDFQTFIDWCIELGSLEDADSYADWDSLRDTDAVRLLRWITGPKNRKIASEAFAAIKAGRSTKGAQTA